MKATEQYFPVVLFIMLYKVVLTLGYWIKSWSVTIQMKATELYVRSISLHRAAHTTYFQKKFRSINKMICFPIPEDSQGVTKDVENDSGKNSKTIPAKYLLKLMKNKP